MRLRSSFSSLAAVSTAEITSLSRRILTADRPGCIGGRPAPGRGPPSLLFFLVVTLVLPCFGGGILENGTQTQTQEQYSTHEQHKRRDHFRHQACRRNLAAGELDPACSRVKRKEFSWLLDTKQQPKIQNEKKWVIYLWLDSMNRIRRKRFALSCRNLKASAFSASQYGTLSFDPVARQSTIPASIHERPAAVSPEAQCAQPRNTFPAASQDAN